MKENSVKGSTRQETTRQERTQVWQYSPLPEGASPGWPLQRPLRKDTGEARTYQGTPEPWQGREPRRPRQAVFMAVASSFAPAFMTGLGLNSRPWVLRGQNSGTRTLHGLNSGTGALFGANHRNRSQFRARLRIWGPLWAWREYHSPHWAGRGISGRLRVYSGTASIEATREPQ